MSKIRSLFVRLLGLMIILAAGHYVLKYLGIYDYFKLLNGSRQRTSKIIKIERTKIEESAIIVLPKLRAHRIDRRVIHKYYDDDYGPGVHINFYRFIEDSNGLIIKRLCGENGDGGDFKVSFIDSFVYDVRGNVLEFYSMKIESGGSRNGLSKMIRTYDKNDSLTSEIMEQFYNYDTQGRFLDKRFFSYVEGRLYEKREEHYFYQLNQSQPERADLQQSLYSYENNGKQVEIRIYQSEKFYDNVLDQIDSLKYDEKGRLIERVVRITNPKDERDNLKQIITYSNDKLVETVNFRMLNGSYCLVDKNLYDYNEKGQLREERFEVVNNVFSFKMYSNISTYFYDENGNKIRRIFKRYNDQNVLDNVSKDEYQYYDNNLLKESRQFWWGKRNEWSPIERVAYTYQEYYTAMKKDQINFFMS